MRIDYRIHHHDAGFFWTIRSIYPNLESVRMDLTSLMKSKKDIFVAEYADNVELFRCKAEIVVAATSGEKNLAEVISGYKYT